MLPPPAAPPPPSRAQVAAAATKSLLWRSSMLQFVGSLLCLIGPAVAWYTLSASGCEWDATTMSLECYDFDLSFSGIAVTVALGGSWGSISASGAWVGAIGGALVYTGACMGIIAWFISLFLASRVSALATAGTAPPAPAPGGSCCCYASIPAVNGVGACLGGGQLRAPFAPAVAREASTRLTLGSTHPPARPTHSPCPAAWMASLTMIAGAATVGGVAGSMGITATTVGAGVPVTAVGIGLHFVGCVLNAIAGCQLKGVPGIGEGACCCPASSAPLGSDGPAGYAVGQEKV